MSFRVFAPHLGAPLGSPEGLPFFSHPAGDLEARLTLLITATSVSGIVLTDWPHNCLSPFMNMNVFDNHFLLALAPVTAQRFRQARECTHELRAPIYVYFYAQVDLVRERCSLQTLHGYHVDRYQLDGEHSLQCVLRPNAVKSSNDAVKGFQFLADKVWHGTDGLVVRPADSLGIARAPPGPLAAGLIRPSSS